MSSGILLEGRRVAEEERDCRLLSFLGGIGYRCKRWENLVPEDCAVAGLRFDASLSTLVPPISYQLLRCWVCAPEYRKERYTL